MQSSQRKHFLQLGKHHVIFLWASLLCFDVASAQSSGSLPPLSEGRVRGPGHSDSLTQHSSDRIPLSGLLTRLRGKPWQERVSILQSSIGAAEIGLIEGHLGTPTNVYIASNPRAAFRTESNQTWWISNKSGFLVFQNFHYDEIVGIALAIYEERTCSEKSRPTFRKLIFSKRVESGDLVAVVFPWPSDLRVKDRCIDIYDLIKR